MHNPIVHETRESLVSLDGVLGRSPLGWMTHHGATPAVYAASRESSHVMSMSVELLENEQYLGIAAITESEDAKFRERKFTVYGLKWDFSHLMGEILTIVDASITDQVQRKAIKDMVKSRFRSKLENIKAQAIDPNFDLIPGSDEVYKA